MPNSYKELRLLVGCSANCHALELITWNLEQGEQFKEVFITSLTLDFYSKQDGLFSNLWKRVKAAWYMLRGKEYLLTELLITDPEDLEKLAKFFTEAATDAKKFNDSHENH